MPRMFRVCQVEGCGRPHKARGHCAIHYQHFLRGVPINPIVQTRDRNPPDQCTEDGCQEPVKAKGLCKMHYARVLRHGHSRNLDQTQPFKVCTKPGCYNRLYAKGVCHQHYIRNRRMRVKYGISNDIYLSMMETQDARCAICHSETPRTNWRSGKIDALFVDHDHRTGKVRALLCDQCNRGLGSFRDDPTILRRAADYLEHHAPPPD